MFDGYFYLYKITNKVNGKVYIGQTINPKARWLRHKSDARSNKSVKYAHHLYCAIRKYGVENFVFEVITKITSLEEADQIEIAFIKQYKSDNSNFGYNISPGGSGKRFVSSETRMKLSKAAKGRQSFLGKHHSEETKEILRFASIGNKYCLGKITSEETKRKLSLLNTGKKASEETKKKMSMSMLGKNAGVCNGMYGKRPEHAKLTLQQAMEIRKEYLVIKSMSKLAAKYGVSKKTILNIIHNRIYVE